MGERIRFHFDPLCPWAWQSSKWIRAVEGLRDIEVEWRLFSLKLINEGKEDPLADRHTKGTPALRALVLVRREGGNEAVDAVYRAIGERVHENGEPFEEPTVRAALADAGLEPSLVDAALADETTMDDVRSEHESAVNEAGAFGVPTIVLSSGRGIFGPVVSTAPEGETAAELWDHVSWLAEHETFFELKRARDRKPGQ